jgi:hypothetical protein
MTDMVGGWLDRRGRRISALAVGHTVKYFEGLLFDWLLYGAVTAYCAQTWGTLHGSFATFAVMTPFSALWCYFCIRFYDWTRTDWLGLETIKGLRERRQGGWIGRFIGGLLRLGDAPAFFALSIYGDPFMVTVYLRKGEQAFDGLTCRDWAVFWASVVFANAYWTFQWTVIVALLRHGFGWIFC